MGNPISTGGQCCWCSYTPTVTLVGGAGNTVPQYTDNDSRYLCIGNMVFIDIHLDGDGGDEGAGTGVINISLPKASSASCIDGDSWFPVGTLRNGTNEYVVHGILGQSDSTIALAYQDTLTNVSNVTGDMQNNATRCIRLKFFYEVD